MRAVVVVFIALGCAVVRMRMSRMIMAVLGFAMATVSGRGFMVSERHALPCDNDRHALERQDEHDEDREQANEPQTHGCIVLCNGLTSCSWIGSALLR